MLLQHFAGQMGMPLPLPLPLPLLLLRHSPPHCWGLGLPIPAAHGSGCKHISRGEVTCDQLRSRLHNIHEGSRKFVL
jgi:hypothetical protein